MEFHSVLKRDEIMTLAGKQTELGMIIGEGSLRQTIATIVFPQMQNLDLSFYIHACVYVKMCVHINTHIHTHRACE